MVEKARASKDKCKKTQLRAIDDVDTSGLVLEFSRSEGCGDYKAEKEAELLANRFLDYLKAVGIKLSI